MEEKARKRKLLEKQMIEKVRGTFTEKQKEKEVVPSLSIGSRSLQDCALIQKLTASVQSKDLDMVLKQKSSMSKSPISVSVSTFLMPSSMLIILNKGRAMLSSNNFDSSSSTLEFRLKHISGLNHM